MTSSSYSWSEMLAGISYLEDGKVLPRKEVLSTDQFRLDSLGKSLRDLRRRCGVTQVSLAERLGIGQTALSHAEGRGDLLVSTLSAYVEALGGNLRLTVSFPDGEVALIPETLSGRRPKDGSAATSQEDQLCLPSILEEQPEPKSKDVVFSIRPDYAQKILDGTKTVELRRKFGSNVSSGSLALIYATTPRRALTGFARIQEVQELAVRDIWKKHRVGACLQKGDFDAYFLGRERGFAILLSSPQPLNRPIELSELRQRFGFAPPQSYQYASPPICALANYDQPKATN